MAEDYATLDHLSGGRVELIIGKGNGPEQAELFGIGRLEAWDTIAENYRLLRQLWSGHKVTWTPPAGVPSIRTTPLTDAEVHPQPLQPKIRIWHGSATAERSVELAAEFGDPVFSANGMNPVTRYAELIRHYRDRWATQRHDPAKALVGAGHGQTYVTRDSQDAVAAYQPVYERFAAMVASSGQLPGTFTIYDSYDDFLERGSALVGSPQQVINKVGRYHDAFGNRLIAIGGHPGNLSHGQFDDPVAGYIAPDERVHDPRGVRVGLVQGMQSEPVPDRGQRGEDLTPVEPVTAVGHGLGPDVGMGEHEIVARLAMANGEDGPGGSLPQQPVH